MENLWNWTVEGGNSEKMRVNVEGFWRSEVNGHFAGVGGHIFCRDSREYPQILKCSFIIDKGTPRDADTDPERDLVE